LENETCESVKWLKGAKLENLEDALVIWIRQVNERNGSATGGVIKEKANSSADECDILCTELCIILPPKRNYIKMNTV
jgi:hypothetical protein